MCNNFEVDLLSFVKESARSFSSRHQCTAPSSSSWNASLIAVIPILSRCSRGLLMDVKKDSEAVESPVNYKSWRMLNSFKTAFMLGTFDIASAAAKVSAVILLLKKWRGWRDDQCMVGTRFPNRQKVMRPPRPLTNPAAAVTLYVMMSNRSDRESFPNRDMKRISEDCDLRRFAVAASTLKWLVRKSAFLVASTEPWRGINGADMRTMKSVFQIVCPNAVTRFKLASLCPSGLAASGG